MFQLVLFVINPFLSLLFSLFVIRKGKCDRKNVHITYFVISLFFAFLSYTQQSTSLFGDTDIVRYYEQYQECTEFSILNPDLYYNMNILYAGFDLVSRLIVSLTGDVRFFSLFWTFLCYILYFLSVENYIKYRKIELTRNNLFWFLLLSIISFQLFVQITETYKQSVSFALFFYGFSLFLLGHKKKAFVFILFSFLCHISSALLLLMFIPLLIGDKYSLVLLFSSFCIGYIGLMEIAANFLSLINVDFYFFFLLSGKADKYGETLEGFSISMVFVLQFLLLFFTYLYIKFYTKSSQYYTNFFWPFLCVLLLNISSPHNFDRFMNLGAIPVAMLFVDVLSIPPKKAKIKKNVLLVFMFFMIFFNVRKTYYRTLDSSGYTSSYMDNSVVKIVASPSFLYLNCNNE